MAFGLIRRLGERIRRFIVAGHGEPGYLPGAFVFCDATGKRRYLFTRLDGQVRISETPPVSEECGVPLCTGEAGEGAELPPGLQYETLVSWGEELGWFANNVLTVEVPRREAIVDHTLVINPQPEPVGEPAVEGVMVAAEDCETLSVSADVQTGEYTIAYMRTVLIPLGEADTIYGSWVEVGAPGTFGSQLEIDEGEDYDVIVELWDEPEGAIIAQSASQLFAGVLCCNDCEPGVLKDTYYLYWPEWGVMKAEWSSDCNWRWTEPDVEISPKTARLSWNSFQERWMVKLLEPALMGAPKCEFEVFGVFTPCNPVGVYDYVAFCEGDCPSCTDPVTVTEEEPG